MEEIWKFFVGAGFQLCATHDLWKAGKIKEEYGERA
jgi:hypothetical protein